MNNFILVGHSLGGGFALPYAVQNKHVKKLVLLSPFIYPVKETLLQMSQNLSKEAYIEREYIPAMNDLKGRRIKLFLKKYKGILHTVDSIKLYRFLKAHDLSEYANKIQVKTLGIIGMEDIVLSVDSQKKGLRLIKSVKILEYKGYGHNVLFAKKEEILKEIKKL